MKFLKKRKHRSFLNLVNDLYKQYKFKKTFYNAVKKVRTHDIPTIGFHQGPAGELVLYYNPKFIKRMTKSRFFKILEHEFNSMTRLT